MASAFSHIAVPIALRMAVGRKYMPWRLFLLTLFLSAAPDLDSISFHFRIPYASQWGHRGFTHSVLFAAFISTLCIPLAKFLQSKPRNVFIVSFISMASHGILDAFTNGGLGVAFLWPFTSQRYFFPWRVIEVSPIIVSRFFTSRGLIVLQSEFYYIWIPCLVLGTIFYLIRKKFHFFK